MSSLETDGNGDKHNITAIVKVADKPGGFWEVLHKIGVSSSCSFACFMFRYKFS